MMGMFLVQRQEKTVRTRIVEFLRAPFTGSWIGAPGFMTVAQIADGAECSRRQAGRVLRDLVKSKEARVADGRPAMFAAATNDWAALARAAESLGRVCDADVAVPILLELLRHRAAVVQEGALRGLGSHMSPTVRQELDKLIASDGTHCLIREIATEMLSA